MLRSCLKISCPLTKSLVTLTLIPPVRIILLSKTSSSFLKSGTLIASFTVTSQSLASNRGVPPNKTLLKSTKLPEISGLLNNLSCDVVLLTRTLKPPAEISVVSSIIRFVALFKSAEVLPLKLINVSEISNTYVKFVDTAWLEACVTAGYEVKAVLFTCNFNFQVALVVFPFEVQLALESTE